MSQNFIFKITDKVSVGNNAVAFKIVLESDDGFNIVVANVEMYRKHMVYTSNYYGEDTFFNYHGLNTVPRHYKNFAKYFDILNNSNEDHTFMFEYGFDTSKFGMRKNGRDNIVITSYKDDNTKTFTIGSNFHFEGNEKTIESLANVTNEMENIRISVATLARW